MGPLTTAANGSGKLMFALVLGLALAPVAATCLAQEADGEPPARQISDLAQVQENRFVGLTKCAACHFPQYKDWKSSRHAKAFDILPTKYKRNAECLKCHTTELAPPSAFAHASDASLAGVSCEACHGPGGDHVNFALTFVGGKRQISEDALVLLRSKIQRTALEQCIQCHTSKGHKPHPEFDREERSTRLSRSDPPQARSFFSVNHQRGAVVADAESFSGK